MPSTASTSAPFFDFRSRAIRVLYCSSSTPLGWKTTLTVLPFAFCAFSNSGMTHLAIQSAFSAFLPPEMELEAIVSVTASPGADVPEEQAVRVRAVRTVITAGRLGSRTTASGGQEV